MSKNILEQLEEAVDTAKRMNEENEAAKLQERVTNLETKHRDLLDRLQPFLNLLERR